MFTVMFFGIIAKTIGDLRWALFAQKGKEGTTDTNSRNVRVTRIQIFLYVSSVEAKTPCPNIPSPTSYNWNL